MKLDWNNSSLACLERCGEQFRRRYIEQDDVPPTPRQVRGTVVHRVAGRALLRKLETRTLPSSEEARDLAADEFTAAWALGVTLSADERGEGAGSVAGKAKDFAVDLAGYHVEAVAPAINPVAVERKIIVKPKDSDLVIHGTIDLIDQSGQGEQIRDLKTSEKSPPKDAADRSDQLTMYGLIRLAEVGALPTSFVLDFLVRTPARQEKKHIRLETARDTDDVRAMVNRLNTAVETVKRGVFVPAPSDAWFCHPTYCPFFATCEYISRGRRRSAA